MKIFLKKPKPLPSAVLIGGGFLYVNYQIYICGRNDERHQGYGIYLLDTLGITTTRKVQPLKRNKVAHIALLLY